MDAELCCPDAAAAMTADLQLADKLQDIFDDVQAYSFASVQLCIVVTKAKSLFHTLFSKRCRCGAGSSGKISFWT